MAFGTSYFDLQQVFVNELIGSVTLTIILGLALIWFIASKKKVPSAVILLFSMLFLLIFAEAYDNILAYVSVIATAAIMFGIGLTALIAKGR